MTDEELKMLVASNAKAIAANSEAITNTGKLVEGIAKRLDETGKLVDDNSRAIQALSRDVAHMVESQQEQSRHYDLLLEKMTDTQAGLVRMLASLDEDRPTIFSKLNTIEGKIDRLLPPAQS